MSFARFREWVYRLVDDGDYIEAALENSYDGCMYWYDALVALLLIIFGWDKLWVKVGGTRDLGSDVSQGGTLSVCAQGGFDEIQGKYRLDYRICLPYRTDDGPSFDGSIEEQRRKFYQNYSLVAIET